MEKTTDVIEPTTRQAQTSTYEEGNSPMRLIELAINQDTGIEKLERLMNLQERWMENNAKKAFYSALSAFQSELPVIKKQREASFQTRNGGEMKYKYASLDDISEHIKPFLVKHGLSYRFEQEFNNTAIAVTCIVTHFDGHQETCRMIGMPDATGNKNAIQQIASTIQYLRRYTLTGALGITTADDDIDGKLPANDNAAINDQQSTSETQQLAPPYSDEMFQKNLPAWKRMIESGKKTPDDIICFVETKGTLTEAQKKTIKG